MGGTRIHSTYAQGEIGVTRRYHQLPPIFLKFIIHCEFFHFEIDKIGYGSVVQAPKIDTNTRSIFIYLQLTLAPLQLTLAPFSFTTDSSTTRLMYGLYGP